METSPFLNRPQGNLKIVPWNINSVKTKIEKSHVESFLSCYDIICLNEIKTSLPVSFPGYVSYISYDKMNGNRGGTCVFIKQYLNNYVIDMDISFADQVWFRLKCVPGVLYGACYVPPSDFEYFNYVQFSNIQEKIKMHEFNDRCIVIGDLNARLGTSFRELPVRIDKTQYSYPTLPDPVTTPNDNATAMLGICIDEQMLLVNNLQTPIIHFPSKKTFRKGREWVSELDTCFVSEDLVKYVQHYDVIYNESLPSDHAPIVIDFQPPSTCLDTLLTRASDLGLTWGRMPYSSQS